MKRWAVGLAVLIMLAGGGPVTGSVYWKVTQLTDNDYGDFSPDIPGSNVVWYQYDGHDSEIFLYDGTTTRQLTDNDYHDSYPQVSGSNVVWQESST